MKKSVKSYLLGVFLLSTSLLGYAISPISPNPPNVTIPVIIDENSIIQTPLGIIPANKIKEKDLPAILMPWVNWIKAKNLEEQCLLNNENEKGCVFAPFIEINEDVLSFDFKINGTSYLNEFWMKVPSGKSQMVWPENILVNGQKGQSLEKDGFALIKVPKGDFTLTFSINKEQLKSSPSLSLAQNFLIIKNKTTTSWISENNQLLWITKKTEVKNESSSAGKNEEIKVYRKLIDDIPLRLETRIQIIYSGKEKEIFIGKVLPEGFNLLQVQSVLSINQKEDGFYVKLKNGEYWLSFSSYSFINSKSIVTKDLVNGVTNEFWSFQNNVNVRQAEIKSAPAVDPKQAFVPQDWQNFPTYNVKEAIAIETVRRGINNQDNLSYSSQRNSWYGFNNDTMLHVDSMVFNNEGKSFMGFDSTVTPKEFSLRNEPQMIVESDKKQGIVLKQGKYPASLYAQTSTDFSAKFISDSKQNLTKWNLTIAPRNRLIHVTGVDKAINSWTDNWNLYTIFAIFLITLGFYKLFGLPLAILSFSSILLFQSDPFLSWTIWPLLLLLMALLKVLPSTNKFTKLVRIVTGFLVIAVSFIFITFTVQEARYIVNGSLEKKGENYTLYSGKELAQMAPVPMVASDVSLEAEAMPTMSIRGSVMSSPASMKAMRKSENSTVSKEKFEENIRNIESQKIQVTTGQPTWSGISYEIVPSSLMQDEVSFYIAKPWMVNFASILQILNLLIVWCFLIMYTLNMYEKYEILTKFPQRLKNNRLVKPFLGEQK